MKTFITKTAPSWSFVLMLLVTVDKSSEFDWVCIDQQLNLVFESRAILHWVPPNSSMVFTFSIDIVLLWIWRSPGPCGNDRNPIILNQYGEQLCTRYWKWVVHFGLFPFLALVKAWVRPLIIFLCEPLRRLETGKGDLDIPWWARVILDRLFPCRMWSSFLSRHCLNMLIGNKYFPLLLTCPSFYNFSSLYSILDSPHRIY